VRKMGIGWNYVGKLTPMRSNISRFSRGTESCAPLISVEVNPLTKTSPSTLQLITRRTCGRKRSNSVTHCFVFLHQRGTRKSLVYCGDKHPLRITPRLEYAIRKDLS